MRTGWLFLALCACSSVDSTPSPTPAEPPEDLTGTLGSGILSEAHWGRGYCASGFDCTGSIVFRNNVEFIARPNPYSAAIAIGSFTDLASAELAAQVAAIPRAEKPGVVTFQDAAADEAVVELLVYYQGTMRYYVSKGWRGPLADLILGVQDEIATCTAGTYVRRFTQCTIVQP